MFPVRPSKPLSLDRTPLELRLSLPDVGSVIRQNNFYSSERTMCSVFTYEFLEKDALSENTRTEDLLGHIPSGRLVLRKTNGSVFRPLSRTASWIRNIRLAPDIYTHNAVIELTEEKLVRVRVLRNIAAGEEVVTWFSEEIILLMNIPFLTPFNIIDNKCYTCHLCNATFETPNPLKIHLAISCGQQTIDNLWIKLHESIAQPKNQSQNREAFISSVNINYQPSRATLSIPTVSSFNFMPLTYLPRSDTASDLTVNTAAQLETIVSNMGTSKQGHLCIYCGKVYSRKYGLKIHIRTHTGFKPLKCKFCLRPFGDPSNLNKHVRLHMQAGNTIFNCHLCQKVMVRKRDLLRHLQTRHNEKISTLPKDASSSSEDF